MPTTDNELLRETMRSMLVQIAGDAPSSSAAAEAMLGTWHQMAVRLVPVIGVRGVDAILGRALHLTRAAFPWLAIAGGDDDGAAQLASFAARLETSDAAAAAEVSHALLLNFIELLAGLIGESLTERLLGPVWAPLSQTSAQETVP